MFKKICGAFFTLFLLSDLVIAAPLTPEQKEATAFIQKMYSYSVNTFEFGYFQGEYDPDKQCLMLEDFFLKKLIPRPKKTQGCFLGIRYPGAGSEVLSENTKKGQMPKPKIGTPIIEGDKTSIAVTSKFGKTVFFLTKTDKGLRVENALYYEKIPTEANACHGEFLKDPTPAQLKTRPACNDY